MPREIVTLQCGDCKERNYSTTKNRKTTTERLEFKKFCGRCRKHTPHKEVKGRRLAGVSEVGVRWRHPERSLRRISGTRWLNRGVSSTVKLSVSKTELGGS